MLRIPTFNPRHFSRQFVLSTLLTLSATQAYSQPPPSCQCLWQGPFTDAFAHADAIITGEVVSAKGNSVDVTISEIMSNPGGAIPDYIDTIRIWGDNGALCRPDISTFPIGTNWVLAIHKITEVPADGFNPATPSVSFGRQNDFFLSKCGSYWLRIQDTVVIGNLTNPQRWSWTDPDALPVALNLLRNFIDGNVSAQTLAKSAKKPNQLKQLMQETKQFLKQQ